MAASLGFIIPVLNEQGRIGGLLQQLRARYPEAELVVVDGGSKDLTVATALPLCTRLLIGEPGRAAQMNLGGHGLRRRLPVFPARGFTARGVCGPAAGLPRQRAPMGVLPGAPEWSGARYFG